MTSHREGRSGRNGRARQQDARAQTGRAMGVFGLGLYVFGALCSWLVQQYRRNVVCMWAIIFVALDVALLWYMDAGALERPFLLTVSLMIIMLLN